MRICWDMLEGVYLTRKGNFGKGGATYIYKESCKECGEPYLTIRSRQSKFCSYSCAKSGENNSFFGKTHTTITKKRMSKISFGNKKGVLNPNYKGNIAGLASYNKHKNVLEDYEVVRRKNDTKLLEVRCTYCNGWYVPTTHEIWIRLNAINNLNRGEGRLYCSENCKQSCPTYNKRKYSEGFKKATSREVSTYLRQMVFERDGWECQKCGNTIENAQLHCHHMDPVAQNPMFQNDMNSCITLCKECHKEVHKLPGCNYYELRCENDE